VASSITFAAERIPILPTSLVPPSGDGFGRRSSHGRKLFCPSEPSNRATRIPDGPTFPRKRGSGRPTFSELRNQPYPRRVVTSASRRRHSPGGYGDDNTTGRPTRKPASLNLRVSDAPAEASAPHLYGPWRLVQALLPLLRLSDHPRIVNVSSEAGSLASMGGGTPAYNVSKVALNALTRMLAAELHPDGILVNSICPGWVATDMGGPGGRPVADGAAGIVWAATLPDDGPTGGFFRDGRPIPW
jgi:hypothetical protein